ncbi:HAD family hydrolase [Amycolatopsis sp. FDAARGOS 1241]|uniref:HAD family hydrolase n=1 Tax=Amycolatopsis sp. FDAARGOS 1241 TaxID=2778070 RepID=UPI001951DB03|nr:HAD-IA family hydrolase [Amycolatopsis sp. FDAARGOS 1241]QRP46050.1 HAD family hydrolase [Amycolatopsis sp. FDAARGOS 1241]
MTIDQLAAALKRTSSVLLDFDGPVCSVFSAFTPAAVAHELRTRLSLDAAPETQEPFDLLSYVARHEPAKLVRAEAELAQLEKKAVLRAAPTLDADAVLRRFHETSRPVVIVSNNSASAVRAYLAQHDLGSLVTAVSSRVEPDPSLLKPHPYLLHRAAAALGCPVADCLMIGDSATDIEAARAAGAVAVGYANKAGKRERFERLGADAIIGAMNDLLEARVPL